MLSCTNTHHDITDFVDLGMVKNTKTWMSWEENITSLRNKKILNMCLRWHISRSYCFVAEVTFNLNFPCMKKLRKADVYSYRFRLLKLVDSCYKLRQNHLFQATLKKEKNKTKQNKEGNNQIVELTLLSIFAYFELIS